ncbi:MAG: hypothetical protein JW814_04255 [Candidatus Krumholzibacteriota bacterium]|nr:hypothetical protein [Candidatus Krumholzibacteriota bacterium]
MKKTGKIIGRGDRRRAAGKYLCVLALIFLSGPGSTGARAQTLRIDLSEVSRQIEIRYYMQEHGTLPPEYILLNGIALYPNFLQGRFDLRKRKLEYDPMTRTLFSYDVPGDHVFTARDDRDGLYFRSSERDVRIPGMKITPSSIDERAESIRRKGFRKTWVDEVRYNLEIERETRRGGGLIDLNIPIKLPKQIEWLIGDGEETRLTVSGKEKITIGGTSRWCANCPVTEGRPSQQKFPDLDMEQQLSVNLQGNIGEKIHVKIDHSSMGGGMQSTNRVSLRYIGLEDEIIKSIDMGDTDLTLSGAQLISHSGGSRGLFGVKVQAQIGLMDLTVIASKEEGENASGSFSGSGGQSSEFMIADYNYVKRQYFYFETPGVSFDTPNIGFVGHPVKYFPVYGGTFNDMIEVFISLKTYELDNYQGGAKFKLKACVDPENNGITGNEPGAFEDWYRLANEGEDYSLIKYIDSASESKYVGIRLNQPLDTERSLAVRYKSDMGTSSTADDISIGDYGIYPSNPDQVLRAELIYPVEMDEEDLTEPLENKFLHSTWNMMMRNVYSLGSAGLEGGALKVTIENVRTIVGTKDIQEETELSYLRIFGLDQENVESQRIPDGLIDDRKGIIDFNYGYVMFPWYEPFNLRRDDIAYFLGTGVDEMGYVIPDYVSADSVMAHLVLNDGIYSDYDSNPKHEYNIVVEATSGNRTFQLNAFDIIEGSEVVSVDGETLMRGSDYDIDYIGGTVSLKGDRLLTMSPDAKVSIDYQHKSLIGGGKRSLLGFSSNMNLSTNSRLNASFLYNSIGSPKYNPRLGDEPTMNMAGDVNGSFQLSPDWMTSVANLLPRVDTDTRSSLNVNAEVAVSIPNPNRKGEAFVDDMEGVEESSQLSLIRRMWYEASPPADPDNPGAFLESFAGEDEFYWYNPVRESTSLQYKLTTSKRDLNPGLDTRENSSVSSLFIKAIDPQPGEWCGIMTGIPGGLDITTAQYLEIWVNDYNTDPDERAGRLHIDFGRIDEDFHQPELGEGDDEKETDWTIEYDTGFPADDPGLVYPKAFDGSTWDSVKKIYRGINSRVGNNYHDTEDLNRNGRVDERNEYYSLVLDLSDEALIDVQRDFDRDKYSSYWTDSDKTRDAGENYRINEKKAWRMYRLDLSKVKLPTGVAPRLDAIQHFRIWVEDPQELQARIEVDGSIDHLVEIAEMKFIGNRWEFDNIRDIADETRIIPTPDMRVKVGTINNKDNPSIYSSPYKVQEEDGIDIREQSLLIEVENFERERSFRLMKRFYGQGMDFQQYREIEFWIRGNQDLTSHDGDVVDFYLQFAYDSLNYYEVVVPLTSQRAGRWNAVHITLSDLTNMKLNPSGGDITEILIHDASDPSKSYQARLRGDPTLFNVRFLYSGLRNRTGIMIPSGEAWFNDIVVDNVRKDIDHAERLSVSTNFGGIFSLSGNWQRTGPEFRSLNQKRGSGVTTNSYSLSAKTEVNHIIPTGGFQLPVSLKYGASTSKPKYLPQKDVEITDAAVQDSLRSVNNSVNFSVAMSRRGSKNIIMKNLFDNLKAGMSYSKSASFSPTAKDTSWTLAGNATYQLQFRKDRELKLFKGIKWRYWLTDFSFRASGARSVRRGYSYSNSEFVKRPDFYSCHWDNEMSTVYQPFESIKFNYRRTEKRNLAVENMMYGVDIGILTSFIQTLNMSYQPKGGVFLISQFNPRFEYNTKYEEDLKPGIRQAEDPEGTRDVYATRGINVVFDVDVGKYAMGFGKMVKIIGQEEEISARKVMNQRASHEERKSQFEEMLKNKKTSSDKGVAGEQVSLDPNPGSTQPVDPTAAGGQTAETEEKKGTFADLGLKRPRAGLGDKKEASSPDSMAVDSTLTADSKEQGKKAADPMLLFRHLLRFLGRVDPVKSTFKIDRRSQFERLYERAGMGYQFGFASRSGTEGALGGPDADPLRENTGITLNLRSGFDITSNLSANLNFNMSKREDMSYSRRSEAQDLTWPDVNLNWRGLQEWAILRRYIERSDLNISYIERTSKKLGEETNAFQITPNWNLRWKNSLTSNFSVAYSKKTTIDRGQELWDKSWSANLELKYDIKGTKGIGMPLPFLNKKKLKFESALTTVLNVSYSRAERYNVPPTSTLSIYPRFTYTFSRNVSGNLALGYKRSAGGIYGYINHEVSLHATAEFKF